MSYPTAPDAAENYVVGSYQQGAYGNNAGGSVPRVLASAGGAGSDVRGDEAYATRLQQEEFLRAQQRALPVATGHRLAPPEGTQYVAMYPPSPAFDSADLGVRGNFVAPHELRLMETFSLGRTVRMLAVLDGLILLLECAYSPVLFLLVAWAPLSGWMAGTRFSTFWTYIYVGYYVLRISVDVTFIIAGSLWYLIVFAVNLVIARYLLRFAKLLNSLTPAEIEQLRNPATVWSAGDLRQGQVFQVL